MFETFGRYFREMFGRFEGTWLGGCWKDFEMFLECSRKAFRDYKTYNKPIKNNTNVSSRRSLFFGVKGALRRRLYIKGPIWRDRSRAYGRRQTPGSQQDVACEDPTVFAVARGLWHDIDFFGSEDWSLQGNRATRSKAHSREVLLCFIFKNRVQKLRSNAWIGVLVGLGRSGRLVAFILLQYHPFTPCWRRVMTKETKNFTSIEFTIIKVWASAKSSVQLPLR